jgi:hypothetical protein
MAGEWRAEKRGGSKKRQETMDGHLEASNNVKNVNNKEG